MALSKIVYTAHATVIGGRDGVARSDDGNLDVKLQPPKEMGGSGKGTNPEQLFAAGYSACFIGALKHVAGLRRLKFSSETTIKASVFFGPRAEGAKGFGIDVALEVHIPDLDLSEAEALVHEAHQICPYSNATRGNIDVALSVV
jgi:osmotically inducible protein OsmC